MAGALSGWRGRTDTLSTAGSRPFLSRAKTTTEHRPRALYKKVFAEKENTQIFTALFLVVVQIHIGRALKKIFKFNFVDKLKEI